MLICALTASLVPAEAVLWLPAMDGGPEHTSEEAAMKKTKRACSIPPTEARVVYVAPNMTPGVCSGGMGVRGKHVGELVRGRDAMTAAVLQRVWVRDIVGAMHIGEPSCRPLMHWHTDNGQPLKFKPGRVRAITFPFRLHGLKVKYSSGPLLHD